MERLLDLDQITLLPPTKLITPVQSSDMSFSVNNPGEQKPELATSLPIFATPISSVVNKRSAGVFLNSGVRPVLPVESSIEERLDMCKWVFCSFEPGEVVHFFIDENTRFLNTNQGFQYHINIDAGQRGYCDTVLVIAKELRRIYGPQVLIMAGSVGCPEGYGEYSRAGIDYMRVGLYSRSTEDRDKFGFYYPMASLLESIKQYKRTTGIGLAKEVKIIADGGICTSADIVKALALGADYVMCGRIFASAIESAGELYKKDKSTGSKIPVSQGDDIEKLMVNGALFRRYCESPYFSGSHSQPDCWRWIDVNRKLKDIMQEIFLCARTAFNVTGSKDWNSYKTNVRYASIG